MDILGQFVENLGTVNVIFAVIFLFSAVVFIHELGHYLVARWCGVGVETFSIGFGPEIFGWTARSGTRWRFAWIPLGGYVKFIDDADAASATGRSESEVPPELRASMFRSKPVWQRAAVVAAGPLANFLLSIVIFAALYGAIGEAQTKPRIDVVTPGSAAAVAGFQPGDVVLAIDGSEVRRFQDFRKVVSLNPGHELAFVIKRGDQVLELKATPDTVVSTRFNKEVQEGRLGIQYRATDEERTYRPVGVPEAVWLGVTKTWELVSDTFGFLARLVTFSSGGGAVGGLVTISKAAGEAASLGLTEYMTFIALISISLGVINLLPIPVLDGGHLMFYAVEAFRGQPLGERTQEIGFKIGLAVILMIMIAVNGPEIYAEIDSWVRSLVAS
ncbi:MAG: RIP metalloprotease RseP [Rhizobiales bacterium]|nr:RIP metalloprotease RseP [Hyphomicrobiales bacterium]